MADRHEADGVSCAVDGIDDSKAANAKFPQSVQLAQQWIAAFRIDGNGANG